MLLNLKLKQILIYDMNFNKVEAMVGELLRWKLNVVLNKA